MSALVGFEALFFGRADYQVRPLPLNNLSRPWEPAPPL